MFTFSQGVMSIECKRIEKILLFYESCISFFKLNGMIFIPSFLKETNLVSIFFDGVSYLHYYFQKVPNYIESILKAVSEMSCEILFSA